MWATYVYKIHRRTFANNKANNQEIFFFSAAEVGVGSIFKDKFDDPVGNNEPPAKQSGNTTMKIAGSYNVEISRRDQHDEYIEYTTTLLNIFRESYSLKHVIISEISPQFEFPNPHSIPEEKPYTLSLFSKAKSPPTRILTSLTLKAQSGWSIPFKFNHLSAILNVYGAIDELILHNFIIDELKLSNTQSKLSIPMVINKLTLNSCTFILDKNSRTGKRNPSVIFQAVSELKLLNISSGKDLSVIDFIKLNKILRKITIDFGSPVFYDSSSTFNFARYNLFFKLLCSGQGAYSNIKELSFINFSLLDNYGHTHHMETKEEESDDWVAPATDTFETLLSYVSTIPKLTITLVDRPEGPMKCVNCGTTKDKPRKKNRYSDWVLLLRPLLRANKNCMVEVLNHRDKLLFRREIEE